MAISADSFFLHPGGTGTLQHRIKRLVVDSIISGRFRPGERMPSSRALARHLGISRITVTIAYTDLVADDYLISRGRSGYFVSDNAPGPTTIQPTSPIAGQQIDWSKYLTPRPQRSSQVLRPADWQRYPYAFVYGQPDAKLFDGQNWRLCALQALGQKEFETLTSDHYERDDAMLVDYIRRNILPRRGISADPSQILITMGAQNALWLTSQLLLTQRRTAIVENPGYPGLRDILAQTRCHTVALDVDGEGLPPEGLPEEVDVVFATVSHQCPTNVTMPVERRRELLTAASERGFLVVEDDYEFELAFERSPSPSLKSMDETGAVIHIGSFSKSLFPGLRLGYLVASEPFIAQARTLRGTVLRHPPGLVQRTAANFLSLGHYDAQINRMRKAYQRRRNLMLSAIENAGLAPNDGMENGGSSFWMKGPGHVDTRELAERLHKRGVVIEPGAVFFGDHTPCRNAYRLAYSSISSARIPKGIEIIAEELAKLD